MKFFILFLLCLFFFHCQSPFKKKPLRLGFGKASLMSAADFEDPLRGNNRGKDIYSKEQKFSISDRVKGMWRPGSGGMRKLADTLFAAALYGEDKKGPFAVIAVDMGSFAYARVDKIKLAVQEMHGILPHRMVLLSSHTHATPGWKEEGLIQCIVLAVAQAKNSVRPVDAASLCLKIDGKKYIINRRVHVEGIGTRTVMFNTDIKVHEDHLEVTDHLKEWIKNLGVDPEKHLEKGKKYTTYGDVDMHLRALFFRDHNTKELAATFVPFAAHSCIVSAKVANGDVSADFPGHIKRRIEQKLGGVALFAQGASGNQRPLNREYSHAFARQYGETLADLIIAGYANLEWAPLSNLEFHDEETFIDLQIDIFLSADQIQAAKDSVERLFDQTKDPRRKRELQNAYWRFYRLPRVRARIRPQWQEAGKVDMTLHAIRFNGAVLLTSKGELFYELGRDMIAPFKDRPVLLATHMDEYVSYFPLEEDYEKGGYEPSVSLVIPGTEKKLIQGAHALLSRIFPN